MAQESQRGIPDEMEAVVLHAPGEWAVEKTETPAVDEVENVLLRMRAVAICGTDPKLMNGKYDEWPPSYPFIPGHEYAGEVVDVHDSVNRFEPGDRVFGETPSGCGYCRMCREGRYNLCDNYGDFDSGHRQIGHTMDGAYAEYVTVPEDMLHHLDDTIPWGEAALLDTNAIALQCSHRGEIDAGDTVAVIGTGTIGLCLVQHAVSMGASDVIAIGNPSKNEMAAELGATDTISYHDDDVVEQVRELTGGHGVDVTLEAVGIAQTVRQAVEMTRKGGRISVDGVPTEALNEIPVAQIALDEKEFVGNRAHANKSEPSERLVRSDQVDLTPLITHEFDLEEFDAAYHARTDPDENALRVVLYNE
ncbi:zinc-binding dehydrogenase [Halomicroarcula sp. GCM10025324]|uniref:zinc-dependent alcohol dehydrogenase n=1 Tax=Haloarcula TaxID=2237 RepID=UPI0023E84B6C|nr:alcohol dehydrogenase catalytic domain-containing protein [Halomicroarcula sp. ZS-22-S1]